MRARAKLTLVWGLSTWTVSSHFVLYDHTNGKLAAYVFNLPKLLELRIIFLSILLFYVTTYNNMHDLMGLLMIGS